MYNDYMKLLTELKVRFGYGNEDILNAIKKKYGIFADEILDYDIIRESLDARQKPNIFMKLNVAVDVKKSAEKKLFKEKNILVDHSGLNDEKIEYGGKSPIVVGFGPAGMFVALTLAKRGLKPIVIEQGKNVYDRQKDVDELTDSGQQAREDETNANRAGM